MNGPRFETNNFFIFYFIFFKITGLKLFETRRLSSSRGSIDEFNFQPPPHQETGKILSPGGDRRKRKRRKGFHQEVKQKHVVFFDHWWVNDDKRGKKKNTWFFTDVTRSFIHSFIHSLATVWSWSTRYTIEYGVVHVSLDHSVGER